MRLLMTSLIIIVHICAVTVYGDLDCCRITHISAYEERCYV